VFVRDMQDGVTRLVSVGVEGARANASSSFPSVSADGRFIAFVSSASNLVANDTNGTADVFVRDMRNGVTRRMSVRTGGAAANAFSDAPDISADGRYVVFASAATNLVAGDTNGSVDVFLRDRVGGVTIRVSVGPGGVQADGPVTQPVISHDGTHVAFVSEATNLVATDTDASADVLVRNLVTDTNTRVSWRTDFLPGSFANEPAINGNGNLVAFVTTSVLTPGDTNGTLPDVYLRNVAAATDELITPGANGPSAEPGVSADGRRVAFSSTATNLVPGDTNSSGDVFVRLR
jgi:Tol biopolymer transport system component